MRKLYLLPLLLCVVGAAGCNQLVYWQTPVQPPRGALFTHYEAPLTAEISGVSVSDKSGEASTMYVRDILFTGSSFAWDDASVKTAKENGNLSEVLYADYEIFEILGVFGQFKVKVYGR